MKEVFPMNKLLFCGTGAADYSAPEEGKEFRKFCHTLLNDTILFDIGLFTYRFEPIEDVDKRFAKVKTVIVTHTHIDHFDMPSLEHLAAVNHGITVYLDSVACARMPVNDYITYIPVENGGTYHFDGHTLHTFSSNHRVTDPSEPTHHYVLDLPDGKSLYYGLDGAWIKNDAANYMRGHAVDLMILDCTIGRIRGDSRIFEHNSIYMIEEMLPTIRACHMIKDGGKIYADHLAKTLHPSHDEVAKDLATIGMCVAKDGMEIEF